ncbi:sigma-54-dependent Fis family transcriptional regulator [Aquabacterium olei]|uniref:Sigma-54-dependent Fis family transcriptional regulator n=1 Tax=Aquabacterium olei TaxID=1296669 RepID=A0A2U8FSU3_9BURK|nr:sigma-54 dependent transcriptional regulator [Aquabacterium olei]AWI53878.1 sigma-54-dependent Fis family transcriptional regulator [Aquabacterium olei]
MSTASAHRLLVIDDEPDLRTLYELTLLREGYDVETADSVAQALQHLAEQRYSAVITDMRLPDGTGLDILEHLEQTGRQERAIVITAYGSAENAVSALKAGAFDYLTKPVDLKQFRSVVASIVGLQGAVSTPPPVSASRPGASQAAPAANGGRSALQRLIGVDRGLQQVRQLIDKVARSMAPVLISGESGTGKELVARAIHDTSTRAARPFIAVNCGAIPEHLLEAEFFGYRKGAFTGASEDREGFFQAAAGGTLFLDELGDLPLAMQSKLLRAIQERAVRPVGATAEMPVDVRLLSATHKDLAAEVQAGRFRQDLYYRLNVIQIRLPALRERREDLPGLCAGLLERLAREAGLSAVPQLSEAALRALEVHPFPGNVRELENLLHRATALSGHATIDAADLGLDAPATAASSAAPTITEPAPASLATAPVPATPAALPTDLAAHLDQVERDILVRALEKHRLNRTAAGQSLGLSLRQMRYRMARLGVQVNDHGIVLGEQFDPEHDPD